jgi:predicted  nucleic acid-binding Zn-ribbon protein
MSNELISDADVEKALDWLRDNAETIGKAKAEAVRADHMLKHIRALAMKISGETSVTAQEREALASEQYKIAIETAASAAGEFERLKALREAAALKIESWRTASSNYRSMKI